MIVPVMAISNLVLTRQIYSEETVKGWMAALPYNMPRVMTPLKNSSATGAGFLLSKNGY